MQAKFDVEEAKRRFIKGDQSLMVPFKRHVRVVLRMGATTVSHVISELGMDNDRPFTYDKLKRIEYACEAKCKRRTSIAIRQQRGTRRAMTTGGGIRKRRGKQCGVCFSECGTTDGDWFYVACQLVKDQHYMCGDCVPESISAVKQAPQNMRGGGLPCPGVGCRSFFSFAEVARCCPYSVSDLQGVRESFAEGAGERKAMRVDPYDDIFKPVSCPACNTPISDEWGREADECAAFKCVCKAAFCGICGKDCRDGAGAEDGLNDAHYHVRHCPYNVAPEIDGNRQVMVDNDSLMAGRRKMYIARLKKHKEDSGKTTDEIIDALRNKGFIREYPFDITAACIA